MAPQDVERRLAAIFAADMVGYSRLMEADEAGTVARQKVHREELIDPRIAEYGGRIVKTTGDGMLAEFPSVVDALRCAVNIQIGMTAREMHVPEDSRIRYRVGINLGDVIVDGDDIYGDGVNIAARLEGLAEPGGVCVSSTVAEQVRGKVRSDLEDLGEQRVKNIERPVHVYRVDMRPEESGRADAAEQGGAGALRRAAMAAGVAALVIGGGAMWWQPWAPEEEPASLERMALPLPDKPSIAVLPFDNLSGDAEQEYFADGMTDDLITDLSKIAGLFVIARNSTFTYKGKPVKVQQVAEDLGVRYVLEGSVRRIGDQVRINAQLIDALSGHHLWAERYDGSLANIFDMQDKIIGQIVAALAVNLMGAETGQASESETHTPQAYDAFLQGWEHYRRQTWEDAGKAIPFFEKAIELDPDYSRAYAGLAAVYWDIANLVWYDALGIEWQHALNLAQENLAKALENPTPKALAVSAEMMAMHGLNDEALAEIDRAIALDPNDPDNFVSKAAILNILGRAGEAEEHARQAMRLNPHYGRELRALGLALFHQERYTEAAETMERVASRPWVNVYDYQSLAAIYGHLGRADDAATAVDKYDEIYGEWNYTPMSVQEAGFWWYGDMYNYDGTYVARLQEGLRKAGVREGPAPAAEDFDYRSLMDKNGGLYSVEDVTAIDAPMAKELRERGVIFIDVRDAGSYARGYIPGAEHLDLNVDLTEENLLLLVDKDTEVVFHCWAEECPYSAYAAAKAILWGFTRVYRFSGGFPAWRDAGYPVKTFEGY
jgi:TolB-like protein/class 3 adenylate cyclase/rhodanese-related sulfurtransferase/tetratricopeptide (TPR) repeat protein